MADNRGIRNIFAVLFFALLLPCCAPFEPSGGREVLGRVGFVLAGSNLLQLADQDPTLLRIRVFKVVSGVPTDQEGSDHEFSIDMSGGTFTVTGVMLGMKEFQLAILNQAREILGEGKAQILVKPGLQTGPQIVININTGPRRRDLPMNVFVSIKKPGETPKVTYRDVQQTVAGCTGCHSSQGGRIPDGDLDLSDFPFKNQTPTMSQEAIVRDMVRWMREPNPDYRMPPRPGAAVPAAEIDRMDQWVRDGLLKFPMSDQLDDLARQVRVSWIQNGTAEAGTFLLQRPDPTGPFQGQCNDLVIGGSYDYELTVLGIGDEAVFTEKLAGEIIKATGPMDHEIAIPYSDPNVTIPVVVQSAMR